MSFALKSKLTEFPDLKTKSLPFYKKYRQKLTKNGAKITTNIFFKEG
jgi:hypothetical protein